MSDSATASAGIAGPPATSDPGVVYAGLVTRALGIVIDALLIDAVAFVVAGAVVLLRSIFPSLKGHHNLAVAIGGIAFALWMVGYFVAFWTTTGQTPGSRVMQIRVVRADGEPIGVRRALVRLVWMALSLPLLWGYLLVLWTSRRRAAFDLVAGTVVVVAPPIPVPARTGGATPARAGAPTPLPQPRGIEPRSTVP